MASFTQRWAQARPTKTFVFWFTAAAVVATIVIGFTWGGWVTGGTAEATAKAMAEDAVVHRLVPICVAAAHHDPSSGKKIQELKDTGSWDRVEYVKKTGWATMPGDKEPDPKVAEECARTLVPQS
jgi:alpha/beta superfamily hydrolase